MAAKDAQYANVLLSTLDEAEQVGYGGYSKFDGMHSPLTEALSFGWWPLRLIWTQIVMRAPFNIRPMLRVRKGINPEAPALFAHANMDLAGVGMPGSFSERAQKCLNWLLEHDSSAQGRYQGRCWGYHHPWQSPGFYQPPGYPNCYITTIVAGALLRGYQEFKINAYLEAAHGSSKFILGDLPVFYETADEKCIAYVPVMHKQMQVININALAGALLAQIAAVTGDAQLLTQARKLMTFVVRQQTEHGAWYYTVDTRQSLVTHDNYHTGMILDALLAYEKASGDTAFHPAYIRGLDFYRTHLFLENGAPKWTNTQVFPLDVHGAAQGILTFSLAGELKEAGRIANWGVTHFYQHNGNFGYQIQRFYKKMFTLAHWCNGWMARGLGSLIACSYELKTKGDD